MITLIALGLMFNSGAALTNNITGTLMVFAAPGDEMVTVPEHVPATNPAVLTPIAMLPVIVIPLAGVAFRKLPQLLLIAFTE